MAISLTGTGGLFTRLGRMVFALNSLNVYMGSSSPAASIKSIGNSEADINAQFLATDQNIIDGLYTQVASTRTSQTAWEQYLQTLAQNTVIQMANDDTPLASQDLTSALNLLVAQMGSATASVNRPTTSVSTITAAHADSTANTGSGVITASVKSSKGTTLDYIFNEVVTALCTLDSQGGTTVRQEQFTLTTPVAATNVMEFNFPLGSGVSQTLTATDATQSNGAGGNLLSNSDFETDVTTPNIPDQWAVQAGTPGTDILAVSGGVFGLGAFQFVTNAGSTPGLTQVFNNVAGNTSTLSPDTVYGVNFWAKKNGTVSAGTIAVSLVQSDGTTVINDDSGAANTISFAEAGMSSTTFTNSSGYFRTPAVLPSNPKIKLYASVALTGSAGAITFGGLALTPALEIYNSGPHFAIYAGPSAFYAPDQFTVAITNDYAGKFQLGLDKFFSLRSSRIALPSAVSPTVSDSLVS